MKRRSFTQEFKRQAVLLVLAVVFQEEKLYLSPVNAGTPLNTAILKETMDRFVRKDNTVSYKGNRYSVPLLSDLDILR